MNCTEEFFIKAIRAFVYGVMEDYDLEKVDTKELYILAKRHSMQGVLCYVSDTHGVFSKDSEFYEKLREDYEKVLSFMSLRRTRAELLSGSFSSMGISHIEFKGSAVADHYPVPELRTFSDVDMLIKEEDRSLIKDFMVKEGFDYYCSDSGAVSCFKKGYEFYEIHTSLNLPETEAVLDANLWEKATPFRDKTFRFEDNFHLAYLISHMEKHMKSGGAGVKMYLDVVLYIKNCEKINVALVREILATVELEGFFDTVLYLCHRWFGATLPDFVKTLEEDLFETLSRLTLEGGVYGDHTQEGTLKNTLAREISSGKKGAKLRMILGRIFPKKSELWRLYPQYEGKNILVPFVWLRHIASVIRRGKVKNLKAVASVDTKSAESRNEFLSSIGCK